MKTRFSARIGISSVVFFMALISTIRLEATPEKFDHLSVYKILPNPGNGPVREEIREAENANGIFATYEYDQKNLLIRENYFNPEGKAEGYLVHHYKSGRLQKSELFNAQNIIRETIEYKTISGGKISSYKVTDTNNQNKLSWSFQYDSKGRLISGFRVLNKDKTESFSMEYEDNQSIQVIIDAKGEKSGSIQTLYARGKVSQRIKNYNTGIQRIDYMYDSNGRLSEMKFFNTERGKFILVKVHKLKYAN